MEDTVFVQDDDDREGVFVSEEVLPSQVETTPNYVRIWSDALPT